MTVARLTELAQSTVRDYNRVSRNRRTAWYGRKRH
jgi:hypothetical protein